jgi:hypothetical protein
MVTLPHCQHLPLASRFADPNETSESPLETCRGLVRTRTFCESRDAAPVVEHRRPVRMCGLLLRSRLMSPRESLLDAFPSPDIHRRGWKAQSSLHAAHPSTAGPLKRNVSTRPRPRPPRPGLIGPPPQAGDPPRRRGGGELRIKPTGTGLPWNRALFYVFDRSTRPAPEPGATGAMAGPWRRRKE